MKRRSTTAGLTQGQVAARVPCSRSSVQRAVARGDVRQLPNGRFAANSPEVMRELRRADEAAAADLAKAKRDLLAAQRDKERALARLREIEVEIQEGRYVELKVVTDDARDAVARIVSVLRGIPQRVALAVDGALDAPPERRAAVVEHLISNEVERALAELRDSLYVQAAEITKREEQKAANGRTKE